MCGSNSRLACVNYSVSCTEQVYSSNSTVRASLSDCYKLRPVGQLFRDRLQFRPPNTNGHISDIRGFPYILLKPRYLSRDDHNQKDRTRKQRTDVGKYSVVNRTIKSWNQLPAGLLASFPCKLNTFRKRIKNVVTSKGIPVGLSVNK